MKTNTTEPTFSYDAASGAVFENGELVGHYKASNGSLHRLVTAANAQLIASAPELLEALESLLAESSLYANEHRPKMTALCETARQAIAKARGEE